MHFSSYLTALVFSSIVASNPLHIEVTIDDRSSQDLSYTKNSFPSDTILLQAINPDGSPVGGLIASFTERTRFLSLDYEENLSQQTFVPANGQLLFRGTPIKVDPSGSLFANPFPFPPSAAKGFEVIEHGRYGDLLAVISYDGKPTTGIYPLLNPLDIELH